MTNALGDCRLVLGLWRIAKTQPTRATLVELLNAGVEAGITCFDTADVYGGYLGEEQFGDAFASSGIPRDAVRIVTKCGIRGVSPLRPENRVKHYDASGAYVAQCIDRSLRALRIERIDVLLLHRPDFLSDADETAAALQAALRAGKVRHVGVSNFSASQQRLLASRLPEGVAVNQIELSILRREPFQDGLLDHCQQTRCIPMAWSPLGGGALFSGDSEEVQRIRAALASVAIELGGATIDQVALAWLLRHPAGIVPILGTADPSRIRAAAAASALQLSRQHWYAIWEAATGAPVP